MGVHRLVPEHLLVGLDLLHMLFDEALGKPPIKGDDCAGVGADRPTEVDRIPAGFDVLACLGAPAIPAQEVGCVQHHLESPTVALLPRLGRGRDRQAFLQDEVAQIGDEVVER